MIYHDERQINCTNIMSGSKHLANVFEHIDGRWYFHAGGAGRPALVRQCQSEGYATFAEARAAVIATWEARS